MYLAAHFGQRGRAPGLDVAGTIVLVEQGVDEGGSAGGGDPGAAAGVSVDDRLTRTPARRRSATRDHQADLRGRIHGHLPHRLSPPDSGRARPALLAGAQASVEEFVDGEEFTFDLISAGGRVADQRGAGTGRDRLDEAARVGQPGTHRPAPARRRAAGGWCCHGSRRARGDGPRRWLRPHGAVPQGRRRGRVRRDRSPRRRCPSRRT